MKTRKILSILLTIVMFASFMPTISMATTVSKNTQYYLATGSTSVPDAGDATLLDSGNTYNNGVSGVVWKYIQLDDEKVLYFYVDSSLNPTDSGAWQNMDASTSSGAFYGLFSNRRYFPYLNEVNKIIIEEGIYKVGQYAFFSYGRMSESAGLAWSASSYTEVYIPTTMTTITSGNFGSDGKGRIAGSLQTVYVASSIINSCNISKLNSSTVLSIFGNQPNFTSIYIHKDSTTEETFNANISSVISGKVKYYEDGNQIASGETYGASETGIKWKFIDKVDGFKKVKELVFYNDNGTGVWSDLTDGIDDTAYFGNYANRTYIPYLNQADSIIVKDDIKRVGNYAFYHYGKTSAEATDATWFDTSYTELHLPSTLKAVGAANFGTDGNERISINSLKSVFLESVDLEVFDTQIIGDSGVPALFASQPIEGIYVHKGSYTAELIKTANLAVLADKIKYYEEEGILEIINDGTVEDVITLLKNSAEEYGTQELKSTEYKKLVEQLIQNDYNSLETVKNTILVIVGELIASRPDLSAETMLGLTTQGRISSAVAGATRTSPVENIFTVQGKTFIILGEEIKNNKKYYFVICEDIYGSHKWDSTPGVTANTSLAKWDMEDEYNIAYWLNTEFWEDTNIPQTIKEHIDQNHVWHTEPMKNYDPFKNETLTVSPLALISQTEWKNNIDKIGQNADYYFRSARTSDVSGNNLALFTGSSQTLGTSNAYTADISSGIRPVFYLSEDFFKEEKISGAGTNIIEVLDNIIDTSLYTPEELNAVIPAPTATITKFYGVPVVGKTLKAEYEYSGWFEENVSTINWYQSSDGTTYSKIAEGTELLLTNDHNGKYIKVSVVPKSVSKTNPVGAEVMYGNAIGPVVDSTGENTLVVEINGASDTEIADKLRSLDDRLSVSLDLDDFSDISAESKTKIYTRLSNMTFTSIEHIIDSFYAHMALEKVNLADETTIEEMLKDEALGTNIEYYTRLTDKSTINTYFQTNDFEDIDVFRTTFYTKVALLEFTTATKDNIKQLMSDYESELATPISTFDDYRLGQIGSYMINKTYTVLTNIDYWYQYGITETGGTGGNDVSGTPITNNNNNTSSPGSYQTSSVPITVNPESEKPSTYSDLDEAPWAAPSILKLTDRGVISGFGDGTVRPNDPLTREMFVTMIVKAFNVPSTDILNVADDVQSDSWYAAPVASAYKAGIISGVGDNKFGVGIVVSRQDMFTILYRAVGSPEVLDKTLPFDDAGDVSGYAIDALAYMVSNGLASGVGDNKIAPKQDTTRAMAAKMIASLID